MKLLSVAITVGIVLLYFLNIALLRNQLLTPEWFIHSGIRFLVGFLVFGVSVFYAHVIKFKNAVYITLMIVMADYIFDYIRQVDSFKLEVMLLGVFMLLWGAVIGYLTSKTIKNKIDT